MEEMLSLGFALIEELHLTLVAAYCGIALQTDFWLCQRAEQGVCQREEKQLQLLASGGGRGAVEGRRYLQP